MFDAADFHRRFACALASADAAGIFPAGFAVYRNTWLTGLLDALDANYPTVAMLLGPDSFKAVALEYARQKPPETPVLALYGAGFVDFLARHVVGREIPYVRDVAALDRLWTECFFASNAPALDLRDYARLELAELIGLCPQLHPATRVARFETPAVTIWHAHRLEGEFEEIEPEWQAERALVTRRGMAVTVTPIDEVAHHLLMEIQSGRTLGLAIAATAEAHPGSNLMATLTTIISNAALAAPSPEDERIW